MLQRKQSSLQVCNDPQTSQSSKIYRFEDRDFTQLIGNRQHKIEIIAHVSYADRLECRHSHLQPYLPI